MRKQFEVNGESFSETVSETYRTIYNTLNNRTIEDAELYKIAAIREMSKMLNIYLEAILNNIHGIDGTLYERM